jgi:PHD finger-like domain-containing protein 5A
MSKHHTDLILCRKQVGISIGRVCETCEGRCVICDSHVRLCSLARICDECNFGSLKGRCIICNAKGVADAYYCKECVLLEKDRDGCPRVVNIGISRTDKYYERKKYEINENFN